MIKRFAEMFFGVDKLAMVVTDISYNDKTGSLAPGSHLASVVGRDL